MRSVWEETSAWRKGSEPCKHFGQTSVASRVTQDASMPSVEIYKHCVFYVANIFDSRIRTELNYTLSHNQRAGDSQGLHLAVQVLESER